MTVHLATVVAACESNAVTLCLFVPRDAISNTDTRYCDQCHWLIWNKIRVSGRTCENLAARSITADIHARSVRPRETALSFARQHHERNIHTNIYTNIYTQPRVAGIFNFIHGINFSPGGYFFFLLRYYEGKCRREWDLNKNAIFHVPRDYFPPILFASTE